MGVRFSYPAQNQQKIFELLYFFCIFIVNEGSNMINWKNEEETLKAYILQGLSYEEIGRTYGCTGSNIKKQAKKLGIEVEQKRKINPNETFNKGTSKKRCLNCGKQIPNRHGKYCSKECCDEYKFKVLVEKWQNGEITGCDTCGTPREFLRIYMLNKHNWRCERCGFDKKNEYTGLSILQIHHKDGDCFNNKEENLELLCPNCHHMTENFGSRNKNSSRADKRTKYYRDFILGKEEPPPNKKL